MSMNVLSACCIKKYIKNKKINNEDGCFNSEG